MAKKKTLGQRVLEWRAINNLTQQQFADLVGVSRLTITLLENRPGWRLKETTRIRIEHIIGGTNE